MKLGQSCTQRQFNIHFGRRSNAITCRERTTCTLQISISRCLWYRVRVCSNSKILSSYPLSTCADFTRGLKLPSKSRKWKIYRDRVNIFSRMLIVWNRQTDWTVTIEGLKHTKPGPTKRSLYLIPSIIIPQDIDWTVLCTCRGIYKDIVVNRGIVHEWLDYSRFFWSKVTKISGSCHYFRRFPTSYEAETSHLGMLSSLQDASIWTAITVSCAASDRTKNIISV